MRSKFILIITYIFSLIMIVISVLSIYVFFAFKSLNNRTSVPMNIGEVKKITMTDYHRNTNKIVVTNKQGIKTVLYLIGEMNKTPVCFSARKTLIIEGTHGQGSFWVNKDCLRGAKGEYICDVNIEEFITIAYGSSN